VAWVVDNDAYFIAFRLVRKSPLFNLTSHWINIWQEQTFGLLVLAIHHYQVSIKFLFASIIPSFVYIMTIPSPHTFNPNIPFSISLSIFPISAIIFALSAKFSNPFGVALGPTFATALRYSIFCSLISSLSQ